MILKPHYTLINTSIGNDPAIVVVNTALRNFMDRPSYPWHLRITVSCIFVGEKGMPTPQEIEVLDQLEDEISNAIMPEHNAIFLARVTCRGERDFLYRVRDPEVTDQVLKKLVSLSSSSREWEYRMENDLTWELAKPELKLLEHDPRFN